MQKAKVKTIDLDAVMEAERFGALAISGRRANRRARMTASGLTTAQLGVVRRAISDIARTLKRSKSSLRVGSTRFELLERGKRDSLVIHGL